MSDAQNSRPRPQYGEYADPADTPQTTDASTQAEESMAGEAHAANEFQGSAPHVHPDVRAVVGPQPSVESGPAGQLPGVPHNLGVTREGVRPHIPVQQAQPPSAAATPTQSHAPATQAGHQAQQPAHGEPYRAQLPVGQPSGNEHHVPEHAQAPLPASAAGVPAKKPGRSADRIITILLLILGAYGALQSAYSLKTVGAEMSEAAVTIFGLEGFVVPPSVNTIGTIGAIITLSLYAVVLIFSIQRLRAKKLAFWVPLSAGVLSIIVTMVLASVAFAQSPELLQAFSDPDAFTKVMAYAEAQALNPQS